MTPATATWEGDWVAQRLGMSLETTQSPLDAELADLVGLAVRRNPRRAHLLVSRVLGKHIPADPRLVNGAGLLLGEMVRRLLCGEALEIPELGAQLVMATGIGSGARQAGATLPTAVLASQPDASTAVAYPRAVVLGYAETATGLGHCVADALRTAISVHSTRRPVAGYVPVAEFEEEHSHATSHLLLPQDPGILLNTLPLVLVDDELSTGTTVLNTIAELHQRAPRDRYVIAALVDLRSADDRDRMATTAERLGTRIDVVSLAAGRANLSEGMLARGQELAATARAAEVSDRSGGAGRVLRARGTQRRIDLGWPAGLPVTGRHGFTPAHRLRFECSLPEMAKTLATAVSASARRILVLGCEELMYAPLRLACALADELTSVRDDVGDAEDSGGDANRVQVRFSTTTRSPVVVVDDPGYAIRSRIEFPAHDNPADGLGRRFAYNLAATANAQAPFDTVVLVLDASADTAGLMSDDGLLQRLACEADRVLLAVLPEWVETPATPEAAGMPCLPEPARTPASARRVPAGRLPEPLRGPTFGSYDSAEVGWLLKDLSHVSLEAPTEEREEAIQSGGAHYAESLPIEYQPSREYQRLFHEALAANASRVAHAVGVVTEMVLAARGEGAVLVSLARAGTPVGILMRRWAQFAHGLDLPHYAVSIVRGRGIDTRALTFLAAHHDPAAVMFVDGWTGKGAIARELAAALERQTNMTGDAFAPDLAVLADPGRCVRLFGTHEDFLVPSACLNSTVSGLVSRTVLNNSLIGPDDFHGAKFYAELAGSDLSGAFLDAIAARFGDVAGAVKVDWPVMASNKRDATWQGWSAVEKISEGFGIGDVNLVKPGVGETTRVLLRRVPWKILVSPGVHPELAHIRLLAAQRGAPVQEALTLPFSCVGLIHPRFTRGATDANGTSASPAESQSTV
ncbi:MAG: phosphoribosyltransferase [Actinomycetota bacterium]